MLFNSGVGDLSTSLTTRKQLGIIRQQVSASGERLATGQVSSEDLARQGKMKKIYALDNELRSLEGYNVAIAQGRTRFEVVQSSLQKVREAAFEVSLGVLEALGGQSMTHIRAHSETAAGVLKSVVGTLNQSVAGEGLFSGSSLSTAAVVDAEQIISDVDSLLSGAPDVATALASVDLYFNDPAGGFATSTYMGSSVDAPALQISQRELIAQDVRADSAEIRKTIQNLALIAAVSSGSVASDSDMRFALQTAASSGLEVNEQMVKLEQKVGMSQATLDRASTRLEVKKNALEVARNEAFGVDLFEEATLFEELQTQLETSYKVLVRLSSLSLSNFLK